MEPDGPTTLRRIVRRVRLDASSYKFMSPHHRLRLGIKTHVATGDIASIGRVGGGVVKATLFVCNCVIFIETDCSIACVRKYVVIT